MGSVRLWIWNQIFIFCANFSSHWSDMVWIHKEWPLHSVAHMIKEKIDCIRPLMTRNKFSMGSKGASRKHDKFSMFAPWWKGIWCLNQVFLHRPDVDLINSDPENGAALELNDHLQIFVRTPKGNSTLIWVSATYNVGYMKHIISYQID